MRLGISLRLNPVNLSTFHVVVALTSPFVLADFKTIRNSMQLLYTNYFIRFK